MRWIRKQGEVESKPCTLDIAFKQDNFQGYTGQIAENIAVLKRLTLDLLKQKKSLKKSIAPKRDQAGWDNGYLLKVLESVKYFL